MIKMARTYPSHVSGRLLRSTLENGAVLVFALLVAWPWHALAEPQLACTITQITNTTGGSSTSFVSISGNGARLGFRSDRDTTELTPCPGCVGNADGNNEVFFFDTTTNNFSQVTDAVSDTATPFLNADGTRMAFASGKDLTGDNPDERPQIFLFDTTTSTLTQITTITDSSLSGLRSISADGTRIAFTYDGDLTGGNPGLDAQIFLFDTTTSIFTQIAQTYNAGGFDFGTPAISGDGTRIVFPSDRDLTPGSPGNADGNIEIFLFDTTTATITQITDTTGGNTLLPSISGDGTRIAFESDRDLTGGNADGNLEVFLFDTTTSTFTQITNTTGAALESRIVSLNADGTRIVFRSDRDLVPGGNPGGDPQIFLFDTTTSVFTQITNTTGGEYLAPSINAEGIRIAFESDRDLTGGNADGNHEVFLATCNTPPVADAGPDQTLQCSGPGGTSVTLDASGSNDPDGDALTYTWKEGTTVLATTTDPTKTATVTLGLGTHTVTLTVDDGNGGTASDTVVVTIQDTTPPTIGTMSATPNILWPANHKMVPVTVTASASDTCDAAPACRIISVSSNEPVNSLGDGDTAPDWVITGNLKVNLRAEQAGTGGGRVYTITVECKDASGNSSTKTVAVTVPHDQRKK